MKVLIFGGRGMLGTALCRVFADAAVIAPSSRTVDITDALAVRDCVFAVRPDLIINAAAYNAAEAAQRSEGYARAMAVNGKAPQYMAYAAALLRVPVIHYSADAVFAHSNPRGHAESAPPGPAAFLPVWGRSKLLGEESVRRGSAYHYVIRTARLFGPPGATLAGKRDVVSDIRARAEAALVITAPHDEVASVAYAPDVARATRALWEDGAPWGTYHLVNEGGATWHHLASAVVALCGAGAIVRPVARTALAQATLRPRHGVLLNTKRPALRPWQEALEVYLHKSGKRM